MNNNGQPVTWVNDKDEPLRWVSTEPPPDTFALESKSDPIPRTVQLEARGAAMAKGADGINTSAATAPTDQPLIYLNEGEHLARPRATRPIARKRALKAVAAPVAIRIKNKAEVIRYSKILIVALEEALDYVPARHHNQPRPALRIDEDPQYLQELRNLVTELRTLNALLSQKSPRQRRQASQAVGGLARHFNTFLGTYAKAMGYGTAALTIGVIAHWLEQAGVAPDVIGNILSHLKLR